MSGSSKEKSRANRATKWAETLTFRDRATFIREFEQEIKLMQSKLAACRRLNTKGDTDVQAA